MLSPFERILIRLLINAARIAALPADDVFDGESGMGKGLRHSQPMKEGERRKEKGERRKVEGER